MNETVKEILGILDAGRPELQVAAAQILGELRVKDPAAVRSLENSLARSPVLGRFVIDALAKIGTAEALQVVARCIGEHEGLADQASHLLSERMPAALPALLLAHDAAAVDRRGRFLNVLAKHLGKETLPVFERALAAPELAQIAGRLLLDQVERLPAAIGKQLSQGLVRLLATANVPDSCLLQVLPLLGRLDPVAARAATGKFVDETRPFDVRAAAIRAMTGAPLTAVQVKGYLQMLEDQTLRPLHDALRDLLSAMPSWPDGMAGTLKNLLGARQAEQKLFALRALRTTPSAETARTAMKFLHHESKEFRAAAAEVLATNRHAIDPLLRALQAEKDPEQARAIAAILVKLAPQFPSRLLRDLAERAVKWMGEQSLAGELLFDLVVAVDGKKAAAWWLERAVRLRKSRRHAEALHLLARLAGTPHLDVEGRYQLALTRLLHDLARPSAEPAQPGNPAMGFFATLLRDGFPLLDRIRKEATLSPEALLKVASHFAEAVGPERRFGAELLRHLATRTRGQAGDEAKQVLRAAGL